MLKVAAVLAVPLAVVGMAASSGCLVVDVREAGPDGMHLIIPVPLPLLQVAVAFAPEEHTRMACPELAEHLPAALQLIEELRKGPDGELVRVEEGDELVVVSIEDGELAVEVHEEAEDVSVRLPLSAVADVLESFDGSSIAAADVVAALRRLPPTDLVHVQDDGEEVKIWVW